MIMAARSLVTLRVFATAALVSLKYPAAGMAVICLCLITYLGPEAPGMKT